MYLSLTQAAELLGVSRQRVHQLIQRGDIHADRLGHTLMLRRDEVERFRQERDEARQAATSQKGAITT